MLNTQAVRRLRLRPPRFMRQWSTKIAPLTTGSQVAPRSLNPHRQAYGVRQLWMRLWPLTLLSQLLLAGELPDQKVLELEEASITLNQFLPGGSYPLITENGLSNRALDKELNLNLNMSVFKYGFWDNRIHSMTDSGTNGDRGQFRLIGWNFKLGVHLGKRFDIYYEHFSQHLLDAQFKWGRFPVQDSIGIKLILYRRP